MAFVERDRYGDSGTVMKIGYGKTDGRHHMIANSMLCGSINSMYIFQQTFCI